MAVITDEKYYAQIGQALRAKLDTSLTYLPRNMAQAILSISGGSGQAYPARLFAQYPLLEGVTQIRFFTDTLLSPSLSIQDAAVSENIVELEYVDDHHFKALLTAPLLANDIVELYLAATAFTYEHICESLSLQVTPFSELTVGDLFESTSSTEHPIPAIDETVMNILYSGVKKDSGSWTFNILFPKVIKLYTGVARDNYTSATISADSYISFPDGPVLNVNQQDASVCFAGIYSCTLYGIKAYKLKWRGASRYNLTEDQQWEVFFLENGDLCLHVIQFGKQQVTKYDWNGVPITVSEAQPYASFYRSSYLGNYEVEYALYDIAKHKAAADSLINECTLNEALSLTMQIPCCEGIDDSYKTMTIPDMFIWKYHNQVVSTLYMYGNSYITLPNGTCLADINQRDGRLLGGYLSIFTLTNLADLRAYCITWDGRSKYNGTDDQQYELWLFENNDAMFRIIKKGEYAGNASKVFNIAITYEAGMTYSLYSQNSSASIWHIETGLYDLSKHHT